MQKNELSQIYLYFILKFSNQSQGDGGLVSQSSRMLNRASFGRSVFVFWCFSRCFYIVPVEFLFLICHHIWGDCCSDFVSSVNKLTNWGRCFSGEIFPGNMSFSSVTKKEMLKNNLIFPIFSILYLWIMYFQKKLDGFL